MERLKKKVNKLREELKDLCSKDQEILIGKRMLKQRMKELTLQRERSLNLNLEGKVLME